MVKKCKLVIVWDKQAYYSLQQVYDYIKEDSPVNAEKVRKGILRITDSLATHPEKYPPDKYRTKNMGSYRAFEKYSYRVTYRITHKEIIILRVRHVKQEPKEY
ncbi:MAG: type II toxin-antitoxin system RelE/ParE family toxin [Cyclobacteriaceae bacterium]|nr:type II toxin-antitoxin system RelE/ParE family toxin [Cyclobacteriaceae bacterium]